jgi:hypothetical protein
MIIYVVLLAFVLSACGEVNTVEENIPTTPPIVNDGSLSITGKITFDKIGGNANRVGLDYDNIRHEPAKQVVLKAIGRQGEVVTETTTDDNGEYRLNNLPKNVELKIRVYAKLKKSQGDVRWDVAVLDNTNGDSQYVIEGSFASTRTVNSVRNLNASLGWSSRRRVYSGVREAAPFAILDSVYTAMKKVISADSKIDFPKLKVHWSVNNVSAGDGTERELQDGQIVTSHYDGEDGLYILGDEGGDTDEFDNHIIIHEWGHYFESKFSRADNIGGPHSEGDMLDMRVAFGEGFGNAFSAIATDDPIYYDTSGQQQALGWAMDIERARPNRPGWFSESSIQRILYDLYDRHDDGEDHLSMGFIPLYDVLVGAQKNTPAFTSIFSFISALQQENSEYLSEINDILQSEDISPITDAYGSTHHQLYLKLNTQTGSNICVTTTYGITNKVDTHKYVLFSLNQTGRYTVSLSQTNGRGADPDFGLYRTSPFESVGKAEKVRLQFEQGRYQLRSGDYILDISDYNDLKEACFNVDIVKN